MMTQEEIERKRHIFTAIYSAMLHNVPKNLRLSSVDWDNESAYLYFYFDGKIEDRDTKAIKQVYDKFISEFDESDMKTSGLAMVRVDEPAPINSVGECVFARKENYDDETSITKLNLFPYKPTIS